MSQSCLQCSQPIPNGVYAVYGNKGGKGAEEEEVLGFLCEECAKRNKYKSIKKENPFQKLEALKALLEKK